MSLPSGENPMYQNFTAQARQVMELANEEAVGFNHEYVGTEHLLLGLIRLDSGMAAEVVKDLGIDAVCIRREIEKIVQRGPGPVNMAPFPHTPRAKRVIELAIAEAAGDSAVDTEHLLLGLLRESEGVAGQVLLNLGVSLPQVRREVRSSSKYFRTVLQQLGVDTAIMVRGKGAPTAVLPDSSVELAHLPERPRQAALAFQHLSERLQDVKEEAIRAGDLEEAGFISDEQNQLEKMRIRFLRKWPKC
jgi:ATP-dependent Clp protease ATP-binding subunit ClpA